MEGSRLNPFAVVRDFERAVAHYTGAPHVVAVNSCTNALFLCLQWFKANGELPSSIDIPKRTYVSVPMQIMHAGAKVTFRDEEWIGAYRLLAGLEWNSSGTHFTCNPIHLWDSARRFTGGMYKSHFDGRGFVCTSHHWSKILGIQQGGCILHDDPDADKWLRRARFDGRREGVAPKDDVFDMLGWHFYLSPEIAAEGLVRLSHLKRDNPDLPNDDYPDLSLAPAFNCA